MQIDSVYNDDEKCLHNRLIIDLLWESSRWKRDLVGFYCESIKAWKSVLIDVICKRFLEWCECADDGKNTQPSSHGTHLTRAHCFEFKNNDHGFIEWRPSFFIFAVHFCLLKRSLHASLVIFLCELHNSQCEIILIIIIIIVVVRQKWKQRI